MSGAGGLLGGGGGALLGAVEAAGAAGAGAPEGGRRVGGGAGAGCGALLLDELAACRSLVTDSSMLGSSPSLAASSSELFLMPYMKYIAKPAQSRAVSTLAGGEGGGGLEGRSPLDTAARPRVAPYRPGARYGAAPPLRTHRESSRRGTAPM